MNHTSIFRGLLVASLLTAPAFVIADHHGGGDKSMPGAQHERMDPVKRTQKHLDELEQKLNLKSEQQTAWKTYSDAALARASERATHMEEHRARGGDHHADMDTASRLEHISKRMRERADKLEQMARDTRAFQNALSPEQQTIFDLYWRSQYGGRGKMRRRN